MTQTQFIQSEIYKLVKYQHPEMTQLQVVHKVNEITWSLDETEKKIHLEGGGYNHVYSWSDVVGIYCLEDENRDFDEKFQEGEI